MLRKRPMEMRSRGPRHRPSRASYRRRQVFAGAVVITILGLGWLALTALLGGLAPSSTTSTTASHHKVTTTTTPPTTTTTDAGLLPQTETQPPMDSGSLTARLTPMFGAMQTDSHDQAMTVFFPESAYLQMKTGVLANPASDYQGRLIAFLDLDLSAYHQALGPNPTSSTLETVNAAPSLAHWVSPGTCENKIGYWHLPNVRVVYSAQGQERSFAIASLISWRGQWYVVHLGPNPRPADVGTVDDPQVGAGVPGPGGGG